MNPHTGHIVTLKNEQKPPKGYYNLTPEQVASLPRPARRALARNGEARLPLDHPLVRNIRGGIQ